MRVPKLCLFTKIEIVTLSVLFCLSS
uniref:Uncharacterized protein n=1 Tax=Arundo donax TaxID=35708 RepID=A0A0A8Y8I5_ARUDO